jgi:hypothetical protein
MTIRDALMSVWEQTGVMPPELEAVDCPPILEHVWRWFIQLNGQRQIGMNANPLSFQEIISWANLMHTHPTPFEVECLCLADHVWLST